MCERNRERQEREREEGKERTTGENGVKLDVSIEKERDAHIVCAVKEMWFMRRESNVVNKGMQAKCVKWKF